MENYLGKRSCVFQIPTTQNDFVATAPVRAMQKPPSRKSIRLREFDYSSEGAYLVTICTYRRKCSLGEIRDGKGQLSRVGKIVQECWFTIPQHFPRVTIDEFVVMPNHTHGILIFGDLENFGWKDTDANLSRRGEVSSPPSMVLQPTGDKMSPLRKTTLGNVVAYFKY
jgi:hypothetical protein